MASKAFVDFASQGSEGTRMPRAKWEFVVRFPLSLPPVPEQRAIGHLLGKLSNEIELSRRTAETLEDTLRTLLPKLISGEIRLHGAENFTKALRQ